MEVSHFDSVSRYPGRSFLVVYTVSVRFKTPATNNCQTGVNASAAYVCQAPSVHHIQLIQGRINPTKASKLNADGAPNAAFNAIDGTVANKVATAPIFCDVC